MHTRARSTVRHTAPYRTAPQQTVAHAHDVMRHAKQDLLTSPHCPLSPQHTTLPDEVSCLAFSPSGDRLLSGSHAEVLLWRVPFARDDARF